MIAEKRKLFFSFHAFHKQLHIPNKENIWQNCNLIMYLNTLPGFA